MSRAMAKIFDLNGKSVGKLPIPKVFKTPLRPDVIKRAVITIQSHRFQRQGRDPMAGKRKSVESMGAGHGISRFPRLKGRGRRGAFAVGTVGGRSAYPPVAEKKIVKRMPRKEMRLALRSAIAATGSKEIVSSRGHMVDDVRGFPVVVADDIQSLKKTADVEKAFLKIGIWSDTYRVKESRKIRAGKGKMRGRKMKHGVGPLIVVDRNEGIAQAARNILGVDVSILKDLNVELLAPGTHPGRLTVWARSAFERLNELS